MPVIPCPPTIFVDLPREYREFLDMAALARDTTHQVIMRYALAMLHADDLSRAVATLNTGWRATNKKQTRIWRHGIAGAATAGSNCR